MSDPFSPNSNPQLMREARIGLTLVALVLALFVGVIFYRITGSSRQLPDHVRLAPVAEAIWPNSQPPADEDGLPIRTLAAKPLPANLLPVKPLAKEVQVADRVDHMAKAHRPPAALVPKVISSKDDRSQDNFSPTPTPQETLAAVSRTLDQIRSTANELKKDLVISPATFEQPEAVGAEAADTETPDATLAKPNRQVASNDFAVRLTPSPARPQALPTTRPTGRPTNKPNTLRPSNTDAPQPCLQPRPIFEPTRPILKSTAKQASTALDVKDQSFLPVAKINTAPKANLLTKRDTPKKHNAQDFAVNRLRPATPAPAENLTSRPRPSANRGSGAQKLAARSPDDDSPTATVAAATVQPVALPAPADVDHGRNYTSQPGDSFWSIAQQHYGDGRYFRALFQYNQSTIQNFDELPAGSRIAIPSAGDLASIWPDLCPASATVEDSQPQQVSQEQLANPSTYLTRGGETLFEIAAQQLGQASRYLEIQKLNEAQLSHQSTTISATLGDQGLPRGLKLILPRQ